MRRYRLEDLKPGLSESFSVQVTESMLEAFRRLSGDENPLHCDPAYARAQGFPDRVAYGMLTAGFYSTLVGMHLPGELALFQGADILFNAPVHPGQTLTVRGEVAEVHEALRLIEIKAVITDQEGRRVSRAKLRVGVRQQPE